MEKQWCYFLFLLWLSYLMVSSVLMFSRGFLLTRVEQHNISACSSYLKTTCTTNSGPILHITNGHNITINPQCTRENEIINLLNDMYASTNVCLPQKSKLLLIIVDALRYEFMTLTPTEQHIYQNKMPIFSKLLTTYPNQSRLYKFMADAPTTTLQRLKGITTGSLPTFIDAGSNFASHNISEDNIIDQLRRENKTLVFLGDDIWDSIYPGRFTRHFSFPGLNAWDLDTVDNGVYQHLLTEVRKADWDLMVVHIAGVDHVGHKYGPFHHEMKRKLIEVNNAIESVVNIMEENMLLYVISDHGSTKTGDHGGDTKLELEAGMFVYSPSQKLISKDLVLASDIVKQIDLVPTISTLLGVPIPFSSLGTIIFDALPTDSSDWQYCLVTLWKNIQQITTYIDQYSKTSDQFNPQKLESLDTKYKELLFRINTIRNGGNFQNLIQDARDYMAIARQMCEDVWIQFDSFSMSRGLLLMFLGIFFSYMIIDGIPSDRLPEIFMSSFICCSYGVMFLVAVCSVFAWYLDLVENLELTLFFATGMSSIFMLAMLVIQNWEVIAINWYDTNRNTGLNVISRLVMLLTLSGLFSNSYILEEASVLLFLTLTILWLIVYNVFKITKSKRTYPNYKIIIAAVSVSIIIRLSQIFWRCREESQWCTNLLIHRNIASTKSNTRFETVVTLTILAAFVTFTRMWLRSCGNLVGFSPIITITRYLPTAVVVCTGGFWILHDLPKETKVKIIASWQVDLFVWIIYAIVTTALITVIVQPLCVYIIPKRRKESMSVYGDKNIIPQLFNQVKGLYKENCPPDSTPVVCGLATVYSATYIVFSIFTLLLVALLLGDTTATAAVLMYGSAFIALIILAVSQYEKANNLDDLFKVSGTSIFCWMLLCQYYFYGTGHQPAFPNIHWSAAFVGTGGNFIHNAIPATLILINTFGSHILFGITLPLLLIAPFTVYVMFPNFANNIPTQNCEMGSKWNHKELKRGELLLYERDSKLLNGVFVLSAKYMLFFGIRMFVCMLVSTIHCRHLMVWTIFAPKLIFEGVGLFITLPSVLISYLLLIRTNSRLDSLIVALDKQSR